MENIVLINGLRKDFRSQISDIRIKDLAKKALVERGYESNVELSIFFVGRKKAKDLNLNYRKMSYIPQVLGFPMSKKADVDGKIRLGDIVICTQKLKYEVVFQKSNLDTVLYSWLIHGIDNLLK